MRLKMVIPRLVILIEKFSLVEMLLRTQLQNFLNLEIGNTKQVLLTTGN